MPRTDQCGSPLRQIACRSASAERRHRVGMAPLERWRRTWPFVAIGHGERITRADVSNQRDLNHVLVDGQHVKQGRLSIAKKDRQGACGRICSLTDGSNRRKYSV